MEERYEETRPAVQTGTDWAARMEAAAARAASAPADRACLVACALAAAVALGLGEAISSGAVFVLFVPALVGGSFFGGFGLGAFVAAAGALAGLAVTGLQGRPDPTSALLFAAVGLASAAGGEWALRARRAGEQAAKILAEREAQLRSIFDAAPDAMIVIDEKGVMQRYSAAAQRMFGWTREECLGRNVSMLMPEPQRGEHDSYLDRYLRTGERRIIGVGRIVVGQRKDGGLFPMELAVGELQSDDGRLFTGFVRDLTERQKTEARLQELQSELIHISRLTALGEMASSLAHELNQPLSAIANYLSGARRLIDRAPGADERAVDAISRASDQALRAGEIIRRMRDFLARGEGERSVEPLAKLTQEASTLALVGAREQGVRISYDLDPTVRNVLVDRVQIQQVIVNLVRNAVDAMADHDGRRELLVSTRRHQRDMALITVADTGPGISPEAAERLFQPFVTTKPQGMGVGLSICRTIVEAHGGQIWTEPNPGGGAMFRFTAPLAEDPEEFAR